ncbi:TonB-dependent receptor [Helicobacter sp. MIT 05-5293]|uniref:TonB-dependent receptor plug domain-containing protein n=1 Tax=Helicobacter sp. MIT 05-5293 TaxID=1548149 RepID=UPI0010FE7468|nr:TonB-dependent receptor plug domain-containing protein [Helicobacter sp. MIT 05-5293]TLD80992.1 TonB-dependent receptor [Helicobacter sp. MIT 05-5293]
MRLDFSLKAIYIYISTILLCINPLWGDEDLLDSQSRKNTDSQSQSTATDSIKSVKLPSSVVTTTSQLQEYQSGETISESMIESNPSGNGDITSLLRILPNVQFDNAQSKSTTPGEIDPANISISGGLFYQNNFMVDGFNMNNDLDPAGGTTNGPAALKSGRSQGFNLDTSLLESIVVQDSNVSAAYGRFTGGVVEANIRKPRSDGWHGGISYQYTGDNFTHYFIHESAESAFATSSDENYQPHFTKHLIKANAEGYITQNLGIIAAFSTTRSFIPLNAYSSLIKSGTEFGTIREQKRISDNYYIKAHYNPTESFTLEANLGYIPQFNTYYNNTMKDSFYTMQSGGWQAGLKGLWDTKVGLWTNTLGYSRLENSRRSDKSYVFSWYASDEKNWAINSANRAAEGGYGDNDQIQDTLNYKSDMSFEPLDIWLTRHTFRVGAELNYQKLTNNRLTEYFGFNNPVNTNNVNCPNGADNLGLYGCSNVKPNTTTQSSWSGQYFNAVAIYLPVSKVSFNNLSYGFYAEDDINFHLGGLGEINTRFGLRFDGDNYMDKHTLAPRFSLNYVTPVERAYQSTLIFGANRYYGRNLFSYRLYDYLSTTQATFTRSSPTDNWVKGSPANNPTSSTLFSRLNVPYDDELMVGLSQNLGIFSAVLKYIHREGKDEIMPVGGRTAAGSTTPPSGYSTAYKVYTNDGSSRSNIVTLMISNAAPIDTFGVKHYYLLAFDWTDTKRTYNAFSADDAYYNNTDIMYNGQVIKYRDRPVDNYARPYTLRLNTTHTLNMGRTRWLWNNFFRYRAGYERMVTLARTDPNYDTSFNGTQYGKMDFKGAFTWDMRIGLEVNVWKGNTLFMNLDIYNVLNAQNLTTASGTNGSTLPSLVAAAANSIPVYEVGRQFWLQVGYKF